MSQESCCGHCLCGAVTFSATGAMMAPNACHCAMCRRWHGALGVYTSAPGERVDLAGAEYVAWYQSSPGIKRGFCRLCGTKLFWRKADGSDLDLAMGCLDTPTGLRIDKHIWVEFKGDYYDIADGRPQYARSSANAQPLPPAPPLPAATAQPAIQTGQCLCGAIHLSIQGPIRDLSVCHCGMCRRWHGHTPSYTRAKWTAIAFTGREHLRWFASSSEARRGFCGLCGSSLFWEMTGADGVAIAAGILDAPTGLRERRHIFVADKGDCYDISGGLPEFPASGSAQPL